MESKDYWENVYLTKKSDSVSWFQPHAEKSLSIIRNLGVEKSACIIDIGGGASTLVDDLIKEQYTNLSVLDLSGAALDIAKNRLADSASKVRWLVEDVTRLELEPHSVEVWHDRAVFHFLTDEEDRNNYIKSVLRNVKPGGHIIVATFAEDGPEKCSGLPVQRYSVSSLRSEFGKSFELLGSDKELHQTPFDSKQSFVYCYFRVSNCRKVD